jgi:hypothetical protein
MQICVPMVMPVDQVERKLMGRLINGALVAAIIIPVIAVISLCILLFLLLRQKIKGKGIVRWQFSVLCTGPCLFRMKHCKAIVVFVAFFYKKNPCL